MKNDVNLVSIKKSPGYIPFLVNEYFLLVGQPAAAALLSGACEVCMQSELRNHYDDTNDDDDFVMVTMMMTIMILVNMIKFRIFL